MSTSPEATDSVPDHLANEKVYTISVLVIAAQRFRTQERNREDARERLAAFVAHGLVAPKARIGGVYRLPAGW